MEPDDVSLRAINQRARLDAAKAGSAGKALSSIARTESMPQIVGFLFLRLMVTGGQANVYEAIHESTTQRVAVKVIGDSSFITRSQRVRFEREVDALARVRHCHVIPIVECGRTSDQAFFLATPLLAAVPLDAYARTARSEGLRAILKTFAKLLEALEAVHAAGLVHRDLKPTNVFVDATGNPMLLDFGLVHVAAGEGDRRRTITLPGQIVGTLQWASPEQARGRGDNVDGSTDLYSVGVMLYEAVSGGYPYSDRGDVPDVLRLIIEHQPAAPLSARSASADPPAAWINAVVLRAMAKSPADRYPSAEAMRIDIERLLEGRRPDARLPTRTRRRRLIWIAAALTLGAGAFVIGERRWRPTVPAVTPLNMVTTENAFGMKLVLIPGGMFQMGSQSTEEGRNSHEPRHQAIIDRKFWISVTEVTRRQFRAVMGLASEPENDGELPITNVSYRDAMAFCRRLSALEKRVYRLPTEAEWEYAVRAGTGTPYSGSGALDGVGWYAGNSDSALHRVGTREPNHWGLFDVHGNACELTADAYDGGYEPDQRMPLLSVVQKGGGYLSRAEECRSAARGSSPLDAAGPDLGFRVVRDELENSQ